MSLLRTLREQARLAKEAEAASVLVRERRTERYTAHTVPAMHALAACFNEFGDNLRLVRPNLEFAYDVPGYGRFFCVPLFDFKIESDVRNREFEINFVWRSRIVTERSPRLLVTQPLHIRTLQESFRRFGLSGFKETKRAPGGTISEATVQASGFITSNVTVLATVDDDRVRFEFANVDRLAVTRQSVLAAVVGDDVFERLCEFLLRENETFLRESWVRSLEPTDAPSWPLPYGSPDAVVSIVDQKPVLQATLEDSSAFLAAPVTSELSDKDLALLDELREAAMRADESVRVARSRDPGIDNDGIVLSFGDDAPRAPQEPSAEPKPVAVLPIAPAPVRNDEDVRSRDAVAPGTVPSAPEPTVPAAVRYDAIAVAFDVPDVARPVRQTLDWATFGSSEPAEATRAEPASQPPDVARPIAARAIETTAAAPTPAVPAATHAHDEPAATPEASSAAATPEPWIAEAGQPIAAPLPMPSATEAHSRQDDTPIPMTVQVDANPNPTQPEPSSFPPDDDARRDSARHFLERFSRVRKTFDGGA